MPKNLEMFTVQVTDSIRTVMLKITANKHRAVVVLDGKKVVGTVSDGDIRRALLKDVLTMSPVVKIMNVDCHVTTERSPRLLAEIMRNEQITVLPVVNDSGELIDVGLAYEPYFRAEKDNQTGEER